MGVSIQIVTEFELKPEIDVTLFMKWFLTLRKISNVYGFRKLEL